MTDKSGNQGQSSKQSQNTSRSIPSPRILPKVDPAKTINYRQEGADPHKTKK